MIVAHESSDDGDRLRRILAYMFTALVAVTIVCFFVIIIGTVVGRDSADFGSGIWPVVFVTPLIALPGAFLLLIGLIILIGRKRSREAAAQQAAAQQAAGQQAAARGAASARPRTTSRRAGPGSATARPRRK